MIEIALEGLEFFAYHGMYEGEQATGNRFGADVIIQMPAPSGESDTENIDETIDYEELYQVVQRQFGPPVRLLETIADRVVRDILSNFDQIHQVTVNVYKFNPPVGAICHRARVTLTRSRE